ncbi:MAG TPA: DmsE family decaheme c-type cytochrome [Burkholderiales bacterium]|nr:DmsE family decaheme c-type cytochrome [Burkholderiales bacterium]
MKQNIKMAWQQSVLLLLAMAIAGYSCAAAADESNKDSGSVPTLQSVEQAVDQAGNSPNSLPAVDQSGKQPGSAPAVKKVGQAAEQAGTEPSAAGGMEESEKKPAKDLVLKGDAKCTRCHNENEEYPVLMIGRTEHGTVADTRTPTCTSCHGDSEKHLANRHVKVDRDFRKNSTTPIADRNKACLACHQGSARILWQGSTHQTHEVACTNCHQIHIQHDKVRERLTQPQVCFTCHKEQRVQIIRPYRHPILEGKVVCSDCHNPHGSVSPFLMVRENVNETCYQCHMEKRGPFVRNHPPVQENCTICHNPHGTTMPFLLKVRPPFLCQECHEPNSHRGTIPDALTGRPENLNMGVILARGCLNCHTEIHGSNNPLSGTSSSGRALRR